MGNTENHNLGKVIMSAKNYAFTINNPTEDEELNLQNLEVGFIIYQLEQGDNNTPHFQGYVQFATRKTLLSAKRAISQRAHLEVARGSPQENVAYCSKDPKIRGPYRHGEISNPGERTDILRFIEATKTASNDAELLELCPRQFVLYTRCIDRIRNSIIVKRTWEMENTVYWGPSGSGKTRRAMDESGDDTYWLSKGDTSQTIWWDGYRGQATVIIDDFYGWLPWTFILRLLDRYPFAVQYKGGYREFTSQKIIITSNTEPSVWYKNVPNDDVTPLIRRINKIERMI